MSADHPSHVVKRHLQSLLCLLAALHLVGGHWGVMQMVAWAQMLRDYSQDRSVAEAVIDTFDGEHPCAMCQKIKSCRAEEEKQKPASLLKMDQSGSWLVTSVVALDLPESPWTRENSLVGFVIPQPLAAQYLAAPATPPPRAGV